MKKWFWILVIAFFVVGTVFGTGVVMAGDCCSFSGAALEESAEPKDTVRKKTAEDIIEKEYADGDITKTEYIQYKRELNNEEL